MNVPPKPASSVRRCLLFALLTALVVAVVLATMARPRPPAITRDAEARIQAGMTRDELEAMLGGPARDDSTGPTELDPDGRPQVLGHPAPLNMTPISEWISDEVMIRVAFDASGRAEWISTCPLRRAYPGIQPTVEHWVFRCQNRFR